MAGQFGWVSSAFSIVADALVVTWSEQEKPLLVHRDAYISPPVSRVFLTPVRLRRTRRYIIAITRVVCVLSFRRWG